MLTPDQIDALRDRFELITDPIQRYLITDIVKRIVEAGSVTRTGRYQAYIARLLGITKTDVKRYLKEIIKAQKGNIDDVFRRAATLTYQQTAQAAGVAAKALDDNEQLQNIISAAVQMADEEFENITQTIGMINPYGTAMPYRDVYISCCDYAFTKVATGAQDHYGAIRAAVKNIAEYGVVVIDYESGRHTSLDAAVRRNIMGGMGLMVEQVEQVAHDDIGADGWEISAHEASAPDHEPYQGKQYTDAQYQRINGTKDLPGLLKRRISTLNCKHIAFPIIWGVSQPQYTPMQLAAMRERNKKGIEYNGKHFTKYEATQHQRAIEREIRRERRQVIVADASGEKDALQTAQIKVKTLEEEYKRFSSAAGLRTQPERLETLGYGPKQAKQKSPLRQEVDAKVPEYLDNDFSDYEPLDLTSKEEQALKDLRSLSDRTGFEYGVIINGEQSSEPFTSSLHGAVRIPEEDLLPGAKVFHSHTNSTPLSRKDLGWLCNTFVDEVGVVGYNNDVYLVSVGYGYRPTTDEFDEAIDKIWGQSHIDILDYPEVETLTEDEREYVALREVLYRTVREFGWTVKGGRLQ